MNQERVVQTRDSSKNRSSSINYVMQRRSMNQTEPSIVPSVVRDVLSSTGEPLHAGARSFMEPRFSHDFTQAPLRSTAVQNPQNSLKVNQPGDQYEQEADRVAEQVMQMPEVSGSSSNAGYDFSQVQIHTDSRAAEAAQALNAQAFTVGHHIVLGAGQYQPGTSVGNNLLAHELTHVIQQTGPLAGADRAQRALVKHRVTTPQVQGRWRLDQLRSNTGLEIAHTRGNGQVVHSSFGEDSDERGGVFGMARAWQTWGLTQAEVGGQAQVSKWVTKHLIFRNDGQDNDFLQLTTTGQLAGNAKAEDLHHARAGAVVWGRITERTAANPTPPDDALFTTIHDGGISAATMGDLGEIETNIRLGEHGSFRVRIPLKRVQEGAMETFSKSTNRLRDVPSSVDEVDVFLGARVEADADIESSIFGLNPLISPDENLAQASPAFFVTWRNRPAPETRTEPAGTSAATSAGEILHRSPNSRESVSRLDRKAKEAENEPNIRLHGVSAFSEPLSWPHSIAPREEVERSFPVHNTAGPTHRTIVLPKPVTRVVADLFNRVFGRT